MSLPYLSLSQARCLHLAAQGLLKSRAVTRCLAMFLPPSHAWRCCKLIPSMLSHVAPIWCCLAVSVRTRRRLDEALRRGELMEYWAHEACFLPRRDFKLIRHRMLSPEKMGWKYRAAWMHEHAEEIEQLVRHIQEHGPVRSADFEHAQKGVSGWWEWKPHKRHLEGLFTAGKVMVVERRNFQRVYDLTRRVMPHWDDERDGLSQSQAESLMLDNSARSLGIFREQWLADYYRLKRPDLKGWRESRAEQQQIIPVEVETLGRMWLHADLLSQLEPALNNALKATHSAVLSPFDPVVWDRKRAAQLFAFDYRLECYTPAAKRQYGYFVLPLLYRGRLVGRMDAKMHRKTGVLEVISLYLEDDIRHGVSLQKESGRPLARLLPGNEHRA